MPTHATQTTTLRGERTKLSNKIKDRQTKWVCRVVLPDEVCGVPAWTHATYKAMDIAMINLVKQDKVARAEGHVEVIIIHNVV